MPSLEYLQTLGSYCLICSAGSIGFGVVSGVVMNLARDWQINWTDRGIVFSGCLFIWLVIATTIQWYFAKRGRGHFTAWMNILSFVIVAIALYLVVSAPHGRRDLSGIGFQRVVFKMFARSFNEHSRGGRGYCRASLRMAPQERRPPDKRICRPNSCLCHNTTATNSLPPHQSNGGVG